MKQEELQIELINRKAKFEYHFISKIEAGVVLTGTEIKSIRAGKVNFTDAYCILKGEEMYIHDLHISPYRFGNQNNHEPKRPRKLLLRKREIRRIEAKVKQKGFTLVPSRVYVNERGLAKVEVALVQGKKNYDKRDSIKDRDTKRMMNRAIKERF